MTLPARPSDRADTGGRPYMTDRKLYADSVSYVLRSIGRAGRAYFLLTPDPLTPYAKYFPYFFFTCSFISALEPEASGKSFIHS